MRHLYAPTPGEFLVGNKLQENGYAVYLPARDIGIDLLAEQSGRFVRLQVKESRTFPTPNPTIPWCSFTHLKPDALTNAVTRAVDCFVFVVHAPTADGHRMRFAPFFILVSPAALESRLRRYRTTQDRAVFWYRDDANKLWEVRGMANKRTGRIFEFPDRDFTDCLEAWDSLWHCGGLARVETSFA